MSLLHAYQHQSGWLQRIPAGLKLLIVVGVVITLTFIPMLSWWIYAALVLVVLGMAASSRISMLKLGKRLLCVEPFALGTALLALPQPNGRIIFCGLLLKSTLCLLCMVLLSATTRFSEIINVLRRLKFPLLLLTTLTLMDRYLFVLMEEVGRLSRARKSRTFVRGRVSAWRSGGTVIALLFVRASERAERIYNAMCARGWKT